MDKITKISNTEMEIKIALQPIEIKPVSLDAGLVISLMELQDRKMALDKEIDDLKQRRIDMEQIIADAKYQGLVREDVINDVPVKKVLQEQKVVK